MSYFATTVREHPELAVFLTLAAGFVLGRVKIGSFTLGNVLGTLAAGVVIGQLGVKVPAIVQVVFLDLYLFATGYKVGPQFIRGLGRSAIRQVALTLIFCVTSLVVGIVVARAFRYDAGTAAGLLAGATTASTIIGTAGDAIGRLGLSAEETRQLLDNMAAPYAVTYLLGTIGTVWFLSTAAPGMLGIDLAAESRALEQKLAGGAPKRVGPPPAYRDWDIRAYRLGDDWAGRNVGELERSFANDRVFVQRIRRGGVMLESEPTAALRHGDVVALAARKSVVANGVAVGVETDDRELLDYPVDALDVVVTRGGLVDHTIAQLAELHGRGVALLKLTRGGETIPFSPATKVNRGDVLRLAGAIADVERAGNAIGYVERSTTSTDMVFVGIGIVLGGLLGAFTVTVGNVPMSLTASGGALIMGLVFGWLRSVYPTFGRIPEPALWVFDTLGLAVFVGMIGLGVGPGFIDDLRRGGPLLPVAGLIMAFVPQGVALLFGRFVLKMHPAILLGACAGASTRSIALRGIQEKAASDVPVLGYTVPYAVGTILLTTWGPVIVLFTR